MAGLPSLSVTILLLAVGTTAAAAGAAAQVWDARPSAWPAAVVDLRRPAAAVPSPARAQQSPQPDQSSSPLRPARPAPPPRPPGRWGWPLDPPPQVVLAFHVGPHRWSPGHRGVDLAGASGAPVHAAAAGIVTFAAPLAGRGVVVVAHADGIRTTYEPVQVQVRVGQTVAAGDVIGLLESSPSHCPGRVCLHWGALRGSIYLDPLLLVSRRDPPRLLPLGST